MSEFGTLLVVGAGGFGRETIELVRALQGDGHSIELVGICDDDPSLLGAQLLGVPVIGPVDAVHDHPGAFVVITIGNPGSFAVRKQIVDRLALDPRRYATLVHPTSVVPDSAHLGSGTIVHAQCVLTADIVVGSHVVMMPHVVLTHDGRVGDFVTFGAGVRLAGGVSIGEGVYLGSGSMVREQLTVGKGSLIGMGAVVTHDVPAGEVWAGVPARRVRGVAEPLRGPQG